ncbi:MAG TPA: hypothetical protein PLI57_08455, partial [Spirochaetota bacterium]|nr:hypothetical protein [Spirochaetota bacterium]
MRLYLYDFLPYLKLVSILFFVKKRPFGFLRIDTYDLRNKLTHMGQIFSAKTPSLLSAFWKVGEIDTYE